MELATKFNTSVATISKWENRKELADNSSALNSINYALNDVEQFYKKNYLAAPLD